MTRRLEAVRAVIVRGVLFGTAPKKLCFAYGGNGRWTIWLPWKWSAVGWVLAGKRAICARVVTGAWELVPEKKAPPAVRRSYAEAVRKWRALARGKVV